jgi:hypothetical protein
MSVNEIDSIRNIEVIIDELHVKQNISQSDIDIVSRFYSLLARFIAFLFT